MLKVFFNRREIADRTLSHATTRVELNVVVD